ncbi:MAG: NrdH-redoxin [bacterium]|nr:MAG: NrdH-redoxin [bacterium]
MYTSEWCPDCWAAKRFLDGKGFEYEEIDLDKKPDAVEFIIKARGKRVVPTLELNGRFMDGNRFDPEKFEKDLTALMA